MGPARAARRPLCRRFSASAPECAPCAPHRGAMVGLSSSSGFLLKGSMVVGATCSVMLFHFAQREVSWISFFTSLLGFVLSFGIVALIPYDVLEALMLQGVNVSSVDPLAEEAPRQLAHSSWELIYWTTFLLRWLLCPVLIEYDAAGDVTTLARVKTSLRRNAVWYATYFLLGSLVLVWLAAGGGDHSGLSAWCIAASNACGLLVSAVLMGYGLVTVPRHLWRTASPCDQLTTLHCVAVRMDEARLSTQFELKDVISEARAEVATRRMGSWDPQLEEAFAVLQATLEESEQLHCELTNGARVLRESGHGSCVGHTARDDDDDGADERGAAPRQVLQPGLPRRRGPPRLLQPLQRLLPARAVLRPRRPRVRVGTSGERRHGRPAHRGQAAHRARAAAALGGPVLARAPGPGVRPVHDEGVWHV